MCYKSRIYSVNPYDVKTYCKNVYNLRIEYIPSIIKHTIHVHTQFYFNIVFLNSIF